MPPGRRRTSGLGVPLLLLAPQVGWVAPVRPTLGLWFVAPYPCAAPGVFAFAVSGASWRLFTGARALCVLFAVSVATWHLFTGARALYVLCAVSVATWCLSTGARAVCGTCLLLVALLGSSPPPTVVLFFFA